MINERIKCSQLEKHITQMKKEIKLSGIPLSSDLSSDVIRNMNAKESKFVLFVKKSFQKNHKFVRYHAMIIRFCITLASKSPSAHYDLRNESTLCFTQ